MTNNNVDHKIVMAIYAFGIKYLCIFKYLICIHDPQMCHVLIHRSVEMQMRDMDVFRPWFRMTHCKQLNVSVRSGETLVNVFQKVLVDRMIQLDDSEKVLVYL